jgi:hypothetical protein
MAQNRRFALEVKIEDKPLESQARWLSQGLVLGNPGTCAVAAARRGRSRPEEGSATFAARLMIQDLASFGFVFLGRNGALVAGFFEIN